jgi:integrase
LYREVLHAKVGVLRDVVRAKRSTRIPVVFSKEEIQSLLQHLSGTSWLICSLLYGSGLRLLECLRLRVKDVDFLRKQIVVREGKGEKDRITLLPAKLIQSLERQCSKVKFLHQEISACGKGNFLAICFPGFKTIDGSNVRSYPAASFGRKRGAACV